MKDQSVRIVREDLHSVVRAYARELSPQARGVIYASDLRRLMERPESCQEVIRAANNTLGTVAGGIVAQRVLDLLKIQFPLLSRISTDFSAENASLNQTISTRLVSVPSVGAYHTTNGYVSQEAVTVDVPITIDKHQFCQVEFNANELGSTNRLLFGEQGEGMHYAIGKDLVEALYALITAENFSETPTIEALVDFDRQTIIQVGVDMNMSSQDRNANTGTRTILLDSHYYGKLSEDVVVVSPVYNGNAGNAISTGVLPEVHGYLPVEANNLPTVENLVGFGLRADALAVAVRPANDYAKAQPGLPETGNIQQITNPDTGLTVTLTRFVDHHLGKSYMRLAWMRGVAVGNPKSGQRLLGAAS